MTRNTTHSVVVETSYLRIFSPDAELQVLQCIAHGLSVDDTARQLGMSATTVKHHRKVIVSRLGAVNASAAVYVAVRQALFD